MLNRVYLGLGSNLDNRLWYLFQAIRGLADTPSIEIVDVSSIYETEPYGVKNQRNYLNAVVAIDTAFRPGKLLQCLKFMERKIGRVYRGLWAPREIDIDILLYADLAIRLPWLSIPHVELHKRRFVLTPLNEIAGSLWVPGLEKTVAELLRDCEDQGRVETLVPRTELDFAFLVPHAEVHS